MKTDVVALLESGVAASDPVVQFKIGCLRKCRDLYTSGGVAALFFVSDDELEVSWTAFGQAYHPWEHAVHVVRAYRRWTKHTFANSMLNWVRPEMLDAALAELRAAGIDGRLDSKGGQLLFSRSVSNANPQQGD
jgi:hypothetical protein